jgi:hypothetical protein
VHQIFRLTLHGADDRRRAVAYGQHANPAGKIEQGVAIDVVNGRTHRPLHRNLGQLRPATRQRRFPPRHNRLTFWTGDLCD